MFSLKNVNIAKILFSFSVAAFLYEGAFCSSAPIKSDIQNPALLLETGKALSEVKRIIMESTDQDPGFLKVQEMIKGEKPDEVSVAINAFCIVNKDLPAVVNLQRLLALSNASSSDSASSSSSLTPSFTAASLSADAAHAEKKTSFVATLMQIRKDSIPSYNMLLVKLCRDNCAKLQLECSELQSKLTPAMIQERQQLKYINKEFLGILFIADRANRFPTRDVGLLERMYLTHLKKNKNVTDDALSEFDLAKRIFINIRKKIDDVSKK